MTWYLSYTVTTEAPLKVKTTSSLQVKGNRIQRNSKKARAEKHFPSLRFTMKGLLIAALCLCTLAAFSDCVTVQVGEFSFPLEAVKKLKDILRKPQPRHTRNADATSIPECANPALPEEFQKLCTTPSADQIFETLRPIARSPELCEICAFAACAGC